MGERKGQNKYYPPDYDPKKGGLNAFLGTHALRERAKKLKSEGILVIRFEMPYSVWCEGCENHVGMGVRYNAEKKKVGMYFTTPIYEFHMKCHLCRNYFTIRTDPKNFDYEIISGLRRQERRWEAADNEQIITTDRETSKKLASDPMYKLEHGETDQLKDKSSKPEIARLHNLQTRWKDDFAANQLMRKIFRTRKKEEKVQQIATQQIQDKYALDIPLLPENPEDKKLATLMAQYRTVRQSDDVKVSKRQEILERSAFAKKPKTDRLSTASMSVVERVKMLNKAKAQQKLFAAKRSKILRNLNAKSVDSQQPSCSNGEVEIVDDEDIKPSTSDLDFTSVSIEQSTPDELMTVKSSQSDEFDRSQLDGHISDEDESSSSARSSGLKSLASLQCYTGTSSDDSDS